MRRLLARLSGVLAIAGLGGPVLTDLLSGLQANHNETVLPDGAA